MPQEQDRQNQNYRRNRKEAVHLFLANGHNGAKEVLLQADPASPSGLTHDNQGDSQSS